MLITNRMKNYGLEFAEALSTNAGRLSNRLCDDIDQLAQQVAPDKRDPGEQRADKKIICQRGVEPEQRKYHDLHQHRETMVDSNAGWD